MKHNCDNNKAQAVLVFVMLSMIRSLFYSEAQDSLKYLIGIATLVVAYAFVDLAVEHIKIKREYHQRRLRLLRMYYEQMLRLEQSDPRRLRHLGDVEEFMNLYSEYKRLKDQGAHITGIAPNERR